MNIIFKAKIWMTPDFIDFLMHLLKPSKITPFKSSWGSDGSVRIEGARMISMQELKRELQEYHERQGDYGDIELEIESVELSEEEKAKVDSVITFEKAIH